LADKKMVKIGPIVVFTFTSDTGGSALILGIRPISQIVRDYVVKNPEIEVVSTLMGKVKHPLTMDFLREDFNNTIRNDKANKFKLRGHLPKV